MTYQPFIVTDLYGQELPGLPTPMLISQGGGEAWQRDSGIWRAAEPTDPPGTVYKRVRVKHVEEFYVEATVQLLDPSDDDFEETFTDSIYVVAQNEAEARALAPAKAAEYWQGRYPNVTVTTNVIRVKDSPF